MSRKAACEIGCAGSAPADCLRRRVEGVCICHCHVPLCYQPDPVRGYPSLFAKERKATARKEKARG